MTGTPIALYFSCDLPRCGQPGDPRTDQYCRKYTAGKEARQLQRRSLVQKRTEVKI
jgi:hypothetical protein